MTWLSASQVDYPDPLSIWYAPTDLRDEGLIVQFPGFLLHTHSRASRQRILGADMTRPSFTFPVDRDLIEWYTVESAYDDRDPSVLFLEYIANNHTQLAIILSRPQPRNSPPEIGLLVEIYRITPIKAATELGNQRYNCQVLKRVRIRRSTESMYASASGPNPPMSEHSPMSHILTARWKIIGGSPEDDDADFVIGEVVPVTQPWAVDGYIADRTLGRRPRSHSPALQPPADTVQARPKADSTPTAPWSPDSQTSDSPLAAGVSRTVSPAAEPPAVVPTARPLLVPQEPLPPIDNPAPESEQSRQAQRPGWTQLMGSYTTLAGDGIEALPVTAVCRFLILASSASSAPGLFSGILIARGAATLLGKAEPPGPSPVVLLRLRSSNPPVS